MKEANVIKVIAKSKATANRIAKAIDHKELKLAMANLQRALEVAEAREAAKDSKRRAANIKKLTSMMTEMGLSPQDFDKKALKNLDGNSSKKTKVNKNSAAKNSKVGPKKGSKVAPKYKIVSEGKTHKWTGRGRMPIVFKNFVGEGGTLDECLI